MGADGQVALWHWALREACCVPLLAAWPSSFFNEEHCDVPYV